MLPLSRLRACRASETDNNSLPSKGLDAMRRKLTGKGWDEARAKAKRALAAMTEEEDEELTRAALADPDNPPLDNVPISRMRPASEVHPDLVARYRGQRGSQESKPVKKQISLRVDPEVVDHFRSLGPGWMARMNDALRKAAGLKSGSESASGCGSPSSRINECNAGDHCAQQRARRPHRLSGRRVAGQLFRADETVFSSKGIAGRHDVTARLQGSRP